MLFLTKTVLLNFLLILKLSFCCFSLGGNLDFLQKSFITLSTVTKYFCQHKTPKWRQKIYPETLKNSILKVLRMGVKNFLIRRIKRFFRKNKLMSKMDTMQDFFFIFSVTRYLYYVSLFGHLHNRKLPSGIKITKVGTKVCQIPIQNNI